MSLALVPNLDFFPLCFERPSFIDLIPPDTLSPTVENPVCKLSLTPSEEQPPENMITTARTIVRVRGRGMCEKMFVTGIVYPLLNSKKK